LDTDRPSFMRDPNVRTALKLSFALRKHALIRGDHMTVSRCSTGVAIASALCIFSHGYALAASPKPTDLGLVAQAGDQAISVTVTLRLRDPAGAEAMMRRVSTPGDPLFQQFLTPDQVQAQFGPSQETIDSVTTHLRQLGLTVERATATTLTATGTPAAIGQAFQTDLHRFAMPSGNGVPAMIFRAPLQKPVVPAQVAPSVGVVLGLSTKPAFRQHLRQAPARLGGVPVNRKGVGNTTATGNPPGLLTVTDFAARYDVTPLYERGITGKGRTLGIVTLANFTPSDVFAYWSSLKLDVDPNRLTVVNVDGGPGAPSDASGSDETTLDVEQSGGIAPGAKIVVYQAPNTSQGFLDAFAAAIHSNMADSISTSWGSWEFFNDLENDPVIDPFSGQTVGFMQAAHELFIEAALQGQSMFAASGDCGAFDDFDEVPANISTVLSVDYPAADPAIAAAGGTTLPGTQTYVLPGGTTFNVTVSAERVWGWDYLKPLCAALGVPDPTACGIFPVGDGGGVSVFWRLPFYQLGTPGVQASQPGQVLTDSSTTPPTVIFVLPANFHGRNVPDVSFNADPETGYTVFYTSDKLGFEVLTFFGGTSFVAPQLNGVTALLVENAGHRVGLLNPLLYALAHSPGARNPIDIISTGDNWFYSGRDGYSPAAGVGVLDVEKLAKWTKPFVD
jgi:kumamolisin